MAAAPSALRVPVAAEYARLSAIGEHPGATAIARAIGAPRTTVAALLWRMRGGTPALAVERLGAVTRDRIERQIAAGKRCGRCWLTLPCDHA